MRRPQMLNKYLLTAIFLITSLLFITGKAHAADISVGATTWYMAWETEWDSEDKIEYDPGFLYGPVISAAFTRDLSLSFVFLYGNFDMTFKESDGNKDNDSINRYDGDLALNYRISSWFKLFAGAKYIRYTWSGNGKHEAIGPGAGISSVIPVGGNFFLLGNFSGLYLKGNEKAGDDFDSKLKEYGFNASLSLAYYIQEAATTLSLGGRYQYVKIDYGSSNADEVDSNNKFYGVTLSAIYSFNI